jgi:hypothetical protein|tara:strand:+ start:106 stop:315 length:210 start_codon:yes stop_codon:yes gene_type:complete
MNEAFAFRKRTIKDVMTTEKREELKANISNHVQAYINSGGQIQHCTPCTFGAKEKLTKRQVALNKKGTR